MTEAEIERIAAGLTKAQRAAVIACTPEGKLSYHGNYWRAAPGLYRKGLAKASLVPTYLTPLGIAVRAHLANKLHIATVRRSLAQRIRWAAA
jgi:hypothetical protein